MPDFAHDSKNGVVPTMQRPPAGRQRWLPVEKGRKPADTVTPSMGQRSARFGVVAHRPAPCRERLPSRRAPCTEATSSLTLGESTCAERRVSVASHPGTTLCVCTDPYQLSRQRRPRFSDRAIGIEIRIGGNGTGTRVSPRTPATTTPAARRATMRPTGGQTSKLSVWTSLQHEESGEEVGDFNPRPSRSRADGSRPRALMRERPYWVDCTGQP